MSHGIIQGTQPPTDLSSMQIIQRQSANCLFRQKKTAESSYKSLFAYASCGRVRVHNNFLNPQVMFIIYVLQCKKLPRKHLHNKMLCFSMIFLVFCHLTVYLPILRHSAYNIHCNTVYISQYLCSLSRNILISI